MGAGLAERIAYKSAKQVDPGLNPTRGNQLKSDLDRRQHVNNSIVNWLMAKKAEKPKKMKYQLEYFKTF